MDELPSMQLTEALFDDLAWADGPCGADASPQNDQDGDVFAFVQALELDEDLVLPDFNSAQGCVPAPQSAAQSTVQAPQPATQRKKETQRVERIRARNREAQARYRQKAKGQAAELESGISRVQASLTSAHKRQQQLQGQSIQLKQRFSNSVAALDAILSVSSLLPDTLAAPDPPDQGTDHSGVPPPLDQPQNCTTACPAAALPMQSGSSPASVATPCANTTPALVATHQPTGSLVFAPAEAPPRPLAAFLHHKLICLDAVDPHAYPHFPEPSNTHPLEMHTTYGTYGAPSATGKVHLRHLVTAFRSSEAAQCGCGVSDIAWFYQTHVPVSGMNSWGQSSTNSGMMVSLSTTFSSGPCIASFILLYLYIQIENSLVVKAMEAGDEVAPDDIASSFSNCGLADWSMESSHSSAAGHHKRRRDTSGGAVPASAQRELPLKSTAEVLAMAGLTASQLDACHVRCGLGALAPMRETVHNIFRGTAKRFCRLVPGVILTVCFERAIATVDGLLVGFTRQTPSRGASSIQTPSSSSGASGMSHESSAGAAAPRSNAARAPEGSFPTPSFPADTDMAHNDRKADNAHAHHPGCAIGTGSEHASGGGGDDTWAQQYKRESGLHTIAMIVAVRAELMALLDDVPAMARVDSVAETSEGESRVTNRKLLEQSCRSTYDFCFGEVVATMDSAKIVFSMIMDAFQPYLGQYYQVDNMHYKLYKEVRPCQAQRARLAEFWMRQARLKRQLDVDMNIARAELAALPAHIPLPHEFLIHLNALLATPSTRMHTAAETHHTSYASPSLPQQMASVFGECRNNITAHSACELDSCFHRPLSHVSNGPPMAPHSNAHSPFPHSSDSMNEGHNRDAATFSGKQHSSYSSFSSGAMSQYSQYSSCTLVDHRVDRYHSGPPKPSQIPAAVRFMGQCPDDMGRAERLLGGLKYVMEAAKDLQVDMLNAEMPGVLLEVDKSQKLWADLFLQQMMPPDFLELCQIAATQQNRCSLFQEPFR